MTYPSEAMKHTVTTLHEWEVSLSEIDAFACDLVQEYRGHVAACEEAEAERQAELAAEYGAPDDSAYRRDMIAAGRGELLGG